MTDLIGQCGTKSGALSNNFINLLDQVYGVKLYSVDHLETAKHYSASCMQSRVSISRMMAAAATAEARNPPEIRVARNAWVGISARHAADSIFGSTCER
jgi:hypothetical protein